MKAKIKELEKLHKGIRYSNLKKGTTNEWWFTISPESFIDKTLFLALINQKYKKIHVLKIAASKELETIIPRKKGVHLFGQFDLYFTLNEGNELYVKYLTDDGYKYKLISSCITDIIKCRDHEFVENKEDIENNILTFESYLDSDHSDWERGQALSLIQNGVIFLAYNVKGEYHFIPSRFVGYKNNTVDEHLENNEKDGRQTTPIIDMLVGEKSCFRELLEQEYIKYCHSLGVDIHNKKRKFWSYEVIDPTLEDMIYPSSYKEGRISFSLHKKRERDRRLVRDAKLNFREKHGGKLFCEACEFNFQESYGIEYIEVHHINALHLRDEDTTTSLEDVCLVCANCHRIIHSRASNYYSIEELKELLNKNKP